MPPLTGSPRAVVSAQEPDRELAGLHTCQGHTPRDRHPETRLVPGTLGSAALSLWSRRLLWLLDATGPRPHSRRAALSTTGWLSPLCAQVQPGGPVIPVPGLMGIVTVALLGMWQLPPVPETSSV